ncbi:hypothetical protein AgCh_012774 [Apium graveolens]
MNSKVRSLGWKGKFFSFLSFGVQACFIDSQSHSTFYATGQDLSLLVSIAASVEEERPWCTNIIVVLVDALSLAGEYNRGEHFEMLQEQFQDDPKIEEGVEGEGVYRQWGPLRSGKDESTPPPTWRRNHSYLLSGYTKKDVRSYEATFE